MLCSRARGFAVVVMAALVNAMPAAQADKPVPGRQIRVNDVDLSYVDQGKGAPVVFVHGAATDQRYWEPQRGPFARRFRFIAYTYRYHGTAPWPDQGQRYSADTHAADLVALLTSLKAGPVHLVGLSYGGLLAAMVAVKNPELVRTLTLAEPALFSLLAERPETQPVLAEWSKAGEPLMAAMKAGDNAAVVRQLNALVTGGSPADFDKLPPGLRQNLTDNARTMPLLFAAPPPTVTCDMLRAVKQPTLVVRGERTPKFFSTIADEVGRCIAGSKLAVVAKASHPMSYDNPRDFNRVVMEFLTGAGAPSR
jgi:pimeloyl-ACP methyl ester carboxylesterase